MTRNKINQLISDAEKQHREKVGPSRKRLATATAEVPDRQRDAENAAAAVVTIHSSFKNRDDQFTALDLAVAEADVTRTNLALSGAKAEQERAQRDLLSDDKRLAELVAVAVRQVLTDVEVIPSFVGWKDRPVGNEMPAVVLTQHAAASVSTSGALSGDVTATMFYSPAIHRGLPDEGILAAAKRMGYVIEQLGFTRTVTPGVDEMRLRVRSAFNDTPLIPVIDENQIQTIGRSLADRLAEELSYDGWAISHNPLTGVRESSHVHTVPSQSTIVSHDIDQDGTRTLVADTALLMRFKTDLTGRHRDDVIHDVIERHGHSKFYPALGVAIASERVTDSMLSIDPGKLGPAIDRAIGTPADARKLVGYLDGNDVQIITRTTLRSCIPRELAEAV